MKTTKKRTVKGLKVEGPKVVQERPSFCQLSHLAVPPHHLIRLPYVATDGAPKCPYEYNNWAHAATHSLLAALLVRNKAEKASVEHWLQEAVRQATGALRAIRKPGAKIVPAPRKRALAKGGAS